jgi:hypothetical protein
MIVFSYAEHQDAEKFHARFGDERITPATRPNWPLSQTRHTVSLWRIASATAAASNCAD